MFTLFLLSVGLAACSASPVLVGDQAIGSRIAGGRDGEIEEVPYMVSIDLDGRQNCGGSVISDYWIVSAAHCFHRDVSRYTVRAGSTLKSAGGTIYPVDFFINHPLYDTAAPYSHDISLVKVAHPLAFSARVQPISLPAQSATPAPGTLATLSGWGFVVWTAVSSPVLQIVQLPVVSREQCLGYYGLSQLSSDMLCAGFLGDVMISACTGDSGGPLVIDGVLYGVVSWGTGCVQAGNPGVFADVAQFRNWIAINAGV